MPNVGQSRNPQPRPLHRPPLRLHTVTISSTILPRAQNKYVGKTYQLDLSNKNLAADLYVDLRVMPCREQNKASTAYRPYGYAIGADPSLNREWEHQRVRNIARGF